MPRPDRTLAAQRRPTNRRANAAWDPGTRTLPGRAVGQTTLCSGRARTPCPRQTPNAGIVVGRPSSHPTAFLVIIAPPPLHCDQMPLQTGASAAAGAVHAASESLKRLLGSRANDSAAVRDHHS